MIVEVAGAGPTRLTQVTIAPLSVFLVIKVPQHIRELRENANALVGASCCHVVPGAYHSLLGLTERTTSCCSQDDQNILVFHIRWLLLALDSFIFTWAPSVSSAFFTCLQTSSIAPVTVLPSSTSSTLTEQSNSDILSVCRRRASQFVAVVSMPHSRRLKSIFCDR